MMPWCQFSHLFRLFHYSVAFVSNKKDQVEGNPNPGNEIKRREDVYGDTGSLGWDFACRSRSTVWKVSVFRVFLVRTFPHLDWIWRDTEYLSVFTPNAGKYGPKEKLQIRTFFKQWRLPVQDNLGYYIILNFFFIHEKFKGKVSVAIRITILLINKIRKV